MKAAIGCVVAIAAIGAVRNIADIHLPDRTADVMSANEQRFEALRNSLPAEGPVGYITDADQSKESSSIARLRVQYSLAPHVLVPPLPFPRNLLDPAVRSDFRAPSWTPITPEWLIGDFIDATQAPAILRREGLIMVRDFGHGVMLLRRETK